MSRNAMLSVLDRMKRGDVTAHGMRSAFRDWAAEVSHFPSDAAELALAHKVANKVGAASRRGSMFNKRRLLMEAWANYCARPVAADAKVLAFAKA